MFNRVWIDTFDSPPQGTHEEQRHLLGGKGAGLKEMVACGIPVPPGLILTTKLCNWFYSHDKTFPDDFDAMLDQHLKKLEHQMGCTLGDAQNPLLVSVRSGARASLA